MLKRALFVVGLTASISARAGLVTYDWVGPNFPTPLPSAIPSDVSNITASFTVDLGPSFDGLAFPNAWTISDGHTTVASGNTDYRIGAARFSTNAFAELIGFDFEIYWSPLPIYRPSPTGVSQAMRSIGGTGFDPGYSLTSYLGDNGNLYTYGQGRFTTTSIPEPGTLSLFAAGLLALGVVRRRVAA